MTKKFLFIFLLIAGCTQKEDDSTVGTNNHSLPAFNIVDSSLTGIDFSNDLRDEEGLNIIEYLYYYNGGGVALGDINNDGLDDIYLTANQKPDKLYLNLGDLKFKDISISAGINQDNNWSTGVTMSDVNNDGWLDIYVCKVGNYKNLKAHNELYINNGDNTFKEQSKEHGLAFSGFSTQASFFDFDMDGDMDMYLLNHSVHSRHSYGSSDLRKKPDALAGDILYENISNNGKTKFIDVTQKAGIYNSKIGYGLALATTDINHDGWLDIYVGNDFHEVDYLYINNGNKTFTESSADYFNHTSRFTMGVDIADINNDEKLDIITLDMMPYDADIFLKSVGEDSDKVSEIKKSLGYQQQYARNHLQLSQGNHFADVALISETYATDWSWSPLILDYDNDGLEDIYIANGIYKRPNDLDYIKYLSNIDFSKYEGEGLEKKDQELIKLLPSVKLPNVLFRNKGDLVFEKIPADEDHTSTFSNGAAYSDLDNDGDLDMVVNNINETATLLENRASNNFLSINLLEANNNINTNGTKVYLYSGNNTFYKEQITVKGFQSSSTRRVHFGLGELNKIDSLKVVWLDGSQTTKKDLTINSLVTIRKENTTPFSYPSKPKQALKEFDYEHQENQFLDYERERLIPEKLSTEGPSIVQADFNADGLKDLFIGGARNQSPVLYLQNQDGSFKIKNTPIFVEEAKYEDVDALAFDIDNDNDLDIYALSGGNDYQEGTPLLEDRIYINDGQGNFTKLKINLLRTNGGSVSSFDYNQDGFEDLFVGSRSTPGNYGSTPTSYLLKNTGNNNFEIAIKLNVGMITDSQFSDIDNDGLIELILVGDWMPITILSYHPSGKLENKTKHFDLDKTNGMWNCVEVVDIDNDGQLDIIAGNTGLNFKWKASEEKPVKMYLDDFDNNKQTEPLIFYDFFGKNVPFASKDQLEQQLPFIKKRFLKYQTFSTVETVFDLTEKSEADIFQAKNIYELRSMAYLNKGTFIPKPLPKQAQLSTIEDFLIDGNDVFFVGNYFGFVAALGECSANAGGVLTLDKNKNFNYASLDLPKHISGRKILKLNDDDYLVITNNGKSCLVTAAK